MAAENGDQQFERALARLLRDASPETHCPDAETLAAYHERTLRLEQMALWKEHISGCVRCQEVLALVERSEDVPLEEVNEQDVPIATSEEVDATTAHAAGPQSPRLLAHKAAPSPAPFPSTVRARWRWLAPIGALAAGLIAWVGIREIQVSHQKGTESVQMARNEQAVPALSAPSSAPAAPAYQIQAQRQKDKSAGEVAENPTQFEKKVSPVPRKTVPPAADLEQPFNAPAAVPAPPPAVNKLENTYNSKLVPPASVPAHSAAGKRDDMQQVAPGAAGAAIGGALVQGAPAQQNQRTQAVQQAQQPEQQPQVGQVTESVTVEAVQPQLDTTMDKQIQQLPVPSRSRAVALLKLASVDSRYIVAPDQRVAWRVGDAGKIERSTDRGQTWKTQSSAASADLTGGSAPSDKICWVVGKSGTILLTTDGGKHWKQITSPIATDLGEIHGTDELHAWISDISSQNKFETSNGGATWTCIPAE